MTLEERMAKMEAAYGTQSELMRELRDAVTVTANLEARQGKLLREHSEWLVFHDKAMEEHREQMKEHREQMKEHREQMKTLDQRIANLVSGIGEFMRSERPAR